MRIAPRCWSSSHASKCAREGEGLSPARHECYVAAMQVTLPDHVPALERMGEEELRRELAVALYAERKLTLVQAADTAGASLFEFQALLRDRHIPQHYDEAALELDLIALRELPPQ
jgi:predicted HTH domain antitoxin